MSAVVVARDHPLVDELAARIGGVVQVDPARLDEPVAGGEGDRLVWVHIVPTGARDEAALLLRSAASAVRTADGAALTFVAIVPSRGLLTGTAGLGCELARGALEALMRTGIGAWSARGDRLVGVVHAGIDGHALEGQRPAEEVRRRTPVGTLGTAAQLADAVIYVGSPRAAYVTGTLLHVDGGWNAYSWIYPARTI